MVEQKTKQVEGTVKAITQLEELKKGFFVVRFRVDDDWYSLAGLNRDKEKMERFVEMAKSSYVFFTAKQTIKNDKEFWNAEMETLRLEPKEESGVQQKVAEEKVTDIKEEVNKIKDSYSDLLEFCVRKVYARTIDLTLKDEEKQALASTLFIALERRLKERGLL